MARHPDQTLWELFTKTLDEDVQKWVHGPSPVEKAADGVVHFTAKVIEEFITMIWAAFKWIVKFPFEYKKEWQQVCLLFLLVSKFLPTLPVLVPCPKF
jgi:hypothetical protein